MKFLAVTALFAATALAGVASPAVASKDITAQDIASACPANNKMCCKQISKTGSSVSQEEKKSLLDLLPLDHLLLSQKSSAARYDHCDSLVNVNQCTNFVACCAGANSGGVQKGLVNIACLALPISV